MATQLFDNKNTFVFDSFKEKIQKGSTISILASSFSLYAYEALKKELNKAEQFRFIYIKPTFFQTQDKTKQQREFYIPKLDRERTLYGNKFEIRLRNKLTQKAIAKECAQWIKKKAIFKSNTEDDGSHPFAIIKNGEVTTMYTPFSEFTTTQLGCEKSENLLSFITAVEGSGVTNILNSFNDTWNNKELLVDVTDKVIENIENVYKENSPEFIYFVTLYNIFHEFLSDINTDELPNESTGFKNSEIWNKLFPFQRDAVLSIISKLEKYNGCILADSVGLGKTFTALSVIKYYECRNKNVLVLCPKKLYDNWKTFKSNYVNNPISKDRLRFDILFHSDLSRNKGMSNGLDLSKINWSNYDLLVIDESHNFRNGSKGSSSGDASNDKKENRYSRLLNKVIKEGVKTKVLMLSATPVNNRFNDLKNQLQLAYEGDSSNIDNLLDTEKGIDDIFRQAQVTYNRWSKLPFADRTLKELQQRLSFDFFKVLDAVTIARSRKHITQYYSLDSIGKFPTRLKPLSRRPNLVANIDTIKFNEICDLLKSLSLAIYVPSDFIMPSRLAKYQKNADENSSSGLTMSGREQGIRRLMSINMLKRLESSIESFSLTVTRVKKNIEDILKKIEEYQINKDKKFLIEDTDNFNDLDFDDEEESNFYIGNKKGQIDIDDLDYIQWSHYLKTDLLVLDNLLQYIEPITPDNDGKLIQLKADLEDKFLHPINGSNKKVIIFTAFADTANYLYKNLSQYIKDEYALNTVLITGSGDIKSTLKVKNFDFNMALTLFSPISKDKEKIYPDIKDEIDVLIATDCISEGQNLQDCDYLINYDIHWNPVRLIQRFGRIDRIGSQNKEIQMVNYWPNMELDEYIKLKGRVESRMKGSVLASTGDENILSTEEENDLNYRKEQLKRMQTEVVDIEEMNSGISIMDLGLNEFRLDLIKYMQENHDIEHTPYGLHAVVKAHELAPEGCIFVLKNRNKNLPLDAKNALHPFYIIYIKNNKEIYIDHLSIKSLLDKFRFLCVGQSTPDHIINNIFNEETQDGYKMNFYSELLNEAVNSIITVKDQSDVASFLDGSQFDLFSKKLSNLSDFELISFLVIKKGT